MASIPVFPSQPVPPAQPDLSGQLIQPGNSLTQQKLITMAGGGNISRPVATKTPVPAPCPKCRDKGWVFTDILNGLTTRCGCEEVF